VLSGKAVAAVWKESRSGGLLAEARRFTKDCARRNSGYEMLLLGHIPALEMAFGFAALTPVISTSAIVGARVLLEDHDFTDNPFGAWPRVRHHS
jgi:hypothetical protein